MNKIIIFLLFNCIFLNVTYAQPAITDTLGVISSDKKTEITKERYVSGDGSRAISASFKLKATTLVTFSVYGSGYRQTVQLFKLKQGQTPPFDNYNNNSASITMVLEAGDYIAYGLTVNDSNLAIHLVCLPVNSEETLVSQKKNLIITSIPRVEKSEVSYNPEEEIVTVDYFDGLGRFVQNVQKNITPGNSLNERKDLITMQEYDEFGRELNNWLPAAISSNYGLYVTPATVQVSSKSTNGNDVAPYSKIKYESSPLNRIKEKCGPGIEWSIKAQGIITDYLSNDDSIYCLYYKVIQENGTCYLIKSGKYDSGQLYVTKTTDEDKNASYEFKNKQGQTILIRKMNNTTNCDTYYVYDDYGNLCYVLPPEAIEKLSDLSDTNEVMKQYAYIYKYDNRNRCIAKRLPGCDWIYYIYDKADRLIFTQDGEQRKRGEWKFSISDALGRIVLTGICANVLAYDHDPLKEIVVKAEWAKTENSNMGYDISGVSLITSAVLTVNYYDGYEFMGLNGVPSITDNNFKPEVKADYDVQYNGGYKGLLTGTITALLEKSINSIYTVMYYNDRGQLIQTKATNHLLGGCEKDYFLYTFTGKLKRHRHEHFGLASIQEVYTYDYDHADRLVRTNYSLNNNSVTLSENIYDDLGRLQKKKQHGEVETTTYVYNIRSWLKSINTASNRFSETLYYNESSNGSIPCYNGNISAMNWKVQNDTQRGYNFHYDGLSRITAADYQNNDTNSSKNYSTTYTYDNMGNIKTLKRYGLSTESPTFGIIDDLTLSYNGNQLSSVTDTSTGEPSYFGAFNFIRASIGTPEYSYDFNGNLTKDSHKGIAKVQYNLLNLPNKIQFASKDTTEYLYDAEGVKKRVLYKTGQENSFVSLGTTLSTSPNIQGNTQTDYCGNVIYENRTLSRILIDGGYVTMNGTIPTYHYYIQDHQGNNRVVFNQSGTIEQTNHYYPFGMTFGEGVDNSDNRYKYNGKELDRMHGLDLYDYGARHLDAAIGRWGVMDPLAEKIPWESPYVYCGNSPVNAIDPDGCSTWVLQNADGTYRVVGGDLNDNDKNIYAYTIKDGNLERGESVGVTTSITSFYNSDKNNGKKKGGWAAGSIIDPRDQSGDKFLENIIMNTPPMFDKYMANAGNGKEYDFKVTNGTVKPIKGIDMYRGMPVGENTKGQIVYTSARDIGNMAAGFVAAANGMSWEASRIAFDAYQSKTSHRPAIEGISTRNAEYYGWKMGALNLSPSAKAQILGRSIVSGLEKIWNSIIK